jgi:hypothetical protein
MLYILIAHECDTMNISAVLMISGFEGTRMSSKVVREDKDYRTKTIALMDINKLN